MKEENNKDKNTEKEKYPFTGCGMVFYFDFVYDSNKENEKGEENEKEKTEKIGRN